MLRVIEVTQRHSKSFEMTSLSRAYVSPYVTMSVSRTVFDMIKLWRDFEIWVRGRSRSLKNGTIRKLRYGFLFAFHSKYGSILYHFRDSAGYWSKIAIVLYPVFDASVGVLPYRLVWKNYYGMAIDVKKV